MISPEGDKVITNITSDADMYKVFEQYFNNGWAKASNISDTINENYC